MLEIIMKTEIRQKKAKCPQWLLKREGISQRQWESRKRKELKNVIKAFGEYRMGCAYCPGTEGEVGEIEKLLTKLQELHKCKNW
jgi:hypothetical protein